jgi:hypothetical protein
MVGRLANTLQRVERLFASHGPRLDNSYQPQVRHRDISAFASARSALWPFAIAFFIVLCLTFFEALQVKLKGQPVIPAVLDKIISPEFVEKIGFELAVAFVVAGIVITFVEFKSRKEQVQMLNDTIDSIGESVIKGVYGIRHDPSYVSAVVASCLAVIQTRKSYVVECDVRSFSPEEVTKLKIDPKKVVKVVVDLEYLSMNIGTVDGVFQGIYRIPKRSHALGDFSQALQLEVGNRAYDIREIEAAEAPINHPLYKDDNRTYVFEIPVAVKSKGTRVKIRAQFAKEISDSEVFTFLLPTIGAKIKFKFGIPGLITGATVNSPTADQNDISISQDDVVWSTEAAMLPYNHVNIWWRQKAEDGAPQIANDDSSSENAPFPEGASAPTSTEGAGGVLTRPPAEIRSAEGNPP